MNAGCEGLFSLALEELGEDGYTLRGLRVEGCVRGRVKVPQCVVLRCGGW